MSMSLSSSTIINHFECHQTQQQENKAGTGKKEHKKPDIDGKEHINKYKKNERKEIQKWAWRGSGKLQKYTNDTDLDPTKVKPTDFQKMLQEICDKTLPKKKHTTEQGKGYRYIGETPKYQN